MSEKVYNIGGVKHVTNMVTKSTNLNEQEVIVDNRDPGVVSSGVWDVSSAVNAYGEDSVYSYKVGDSFSWPLTISSPGVYEIYAWWTITGTRKNNVPYVIKQNDTEIARFFVNQQENGGQWNLMGKVTLQQGEMNIVVLNEEATGNHVSADAVRAVLVDAQIPIEKYLYATWMPNTEDDLAGYKLYHSPTINGTYTELISVTANDTSCEIQGLDLDQEHYFKLTAYDTSDNESEFSNVASYIPSPGEDITPPEAPTGLTIEVVEQ